MEPVNRPARPDRLVLLGTAGGAATPLRDTTPPSATHGICSAIVTGGRIYLVDAGQSAARQLTIADPLGRGPDTVMADLEAIFITHLHSDHTLDVANLVLGGFDQGWPERSVPVVGPWPRAITKDDYPESELRPGDRIQAPGTRDFVDRLLSAYAADGLDRQYASRRVPLGSRLHGVDIVPPSGVDTATPAGPAIEPWVVFEDDRVRVSATVVAHGAMRPALGFRFDSADWSVVFSGDTAPSENLIRLARGADVLVHEAIDPEFGARYFGPPPYTDWQQGVIDVVLAKHTSATVVGSIAQRAGVGLLVLSHLVPGNLPADYWAGLVGGFDGPIVIGEDLAEFKLG